MWPLEVIKKMNATSNKECSRCGKVVPNDKPGRVCFPKAAKRYGEFEIETKPLKSTPS